MKIYCSGIDLAEAVGKVSKALSQKPANPILECIKLSAYGDTLNLIATDGFFTIQKTIKADVEMDGEVVVVGRPFGELARKISGEQTGLELCQGNILKISYGDSQTNLQCSSLDEYPPILEFNADNTFSILQGEFKDMINKIIGSAATDDSRPILKGCLLELKENKLSGIALDGFRLAIAKKTLDYSYPETKAIVPARSLAEISKTLDQDDEFATIKLSAKRFMVDCGHTKITSALLDGNYINYQQIINLDHKSIMKVNKKHFEESIERASIMSRADRNNEIKFDIKDKSLSILSRCTFGNANQQLPCSLTGPDLAIGLNAKFMQDCLRVIGDEFIKLSFTTSSTPLLVTPLEGDDYLFLILPIRMTS